MKHDDPFAEPSDTEKTVVRLNPGGRLFEAPPPPPAPRADTPASPPPDPPAPPPEPEVTAGAVDAPATGLNPLNAAAAPLFLLVARIRNRAQHADPAALRQSVIAEIRGFEDRAARAGIPAQQIRVARYALCATIDDVVLNTPWGGQSVWTQQSMVGTFHGETHGGDRFYDLLTRLQDNPGANRTLLEFLYMCLSLGFEGRLRVDPRGAERHAAIRDGLARSIRAGRGAAETDLSPRWRGLRVAHRQVAAWMPVWLTAGVTTGAAAFAFLAFSAALGIETERLRGEILSLDLGGPVALARPAPPPPPPPEPPQAAARDDLRAFLAPEIAQGLVALESAGNAVTIRLTVPGLFGPASDALEDRFVALVDRVAAALEPEEGRIIVAGHSDNIPISTARFPSNTHLSLARAETVMARIAGTVTDATRLSAEGRADAEPIAPNDTTEGRAKNRRIDVILVKAG